ncbi:hypothetical protein [Pseudalkalibacillus hwajinpoensis]|uniref:Lipoprotein n=1 Tax=Guptibacillus hwajinpoensis TaxID=208199 RepID=A0A4U1MLQ4_9BACL|nr:hypothetical protein [Pseudalkalibacillus hwajinpoensis]TKD71565.1 hypothetical protein FBF83_01810 [Pseudalkalibacillus hwajinpoensis]
MKKLLLPFMLFALVFAAACSNDEVNNSNENASNSANSEETTNSETDVKGALLDFQMNLIQTVNKNDSPIYGFEAAKVAEDKPSDEELAKMKSEAESAAKQVAEDVRGVEVPAELETYQSDIESALEDLAKSYETRAANLSDEAEAAYEESDAQFASFEEKMGSVYKDAGLTAPSFAADLVD